MKASTALIIAMLMVAVACTHKETVKPSASAPGMMCTTLFDQTGLSVCTEEGQGKINTYESCTLNMPVQDPKKLTPCPLSKPVPEPPCKPEPAKVSTVTPQKECTVPGIKSIHFDYNKQDIKKEDKPTLHELAKMLKADKNSNVVIEGNCDERGTNEYNLALGERRAKAAKDFLMKLGVSTTQIKTSSNGEEDPVCTEHNESCWAKNRRDDFILK